MNIYFAHSTKGDYRKELYQPIIEHSKNLPHHFILPHDLQEEPTHSKNIIANCQLVVAEVSEASLGVGIELGWANDLHIPIIALHKNTVKPSSSLNLITKKIIPYNNANEIPRIIVEHL